MDIQKGADRPLSLYWPKLRVLKQEQQRNYGKL